MRIIKQANHAYCERKYGVQIMPNEIKEKVSIMRGFPYKNRQQTSKCQNNHRNICNAKPPKISNEFLYRKLLD